ncbi:MAG: glycoside hydrolase family 16 protein [Bacteroidales bacterium]|nr:glycoside hydrolase family 16 protein [Bacteroidales bacterium]
MATPSKLKVFSNRLFGRFKSTEEVESNRKALEVEYYEWVEFAQSDDYKRFEELKSWEATKEYLTVKKEVEAIKYSESPEQREEQELKKLSRSHSIRNFLKIAKSETPDFYQKMEHSQLVKELKELQQFIATPDYQAKKNQYRKDNSAEYQKEFRLKELLGNPDIKKYIKLEKENDLKEYFQTENSEQLKRYNELSEKVSTEDFKNRKAYLLSKNKFEQTDAYKNLQEFKQLESSEKIKWFFRLNRSNKFDDLKAWNLAFYDDFDSKNIDPHKWLTKFFWGEALVGKPYSFTTDNQNYTEKGNIEIGNSTLKIITRKEASEGLAWDKKFGFTPKAFAYTSGIINTGHSFRLKEGRIEAKVRMSSVQGISHAFYLVGNEMLPEVDVFLKNNAKPSGISAAYFWPNGKSKVAKSVSSIGGLKLGENFYIFGVEWDSNNIVWTINGIPYKVEPNRHPGISYYMVFTSAVKGSVDDSLLPATLELDWVKCWEKKE